MSDDSGVGASAASGPSATPGAGRTAPPTVTDARACAGRLLAGIVHDLKNPLAVVDGYAQLLHARLPEETESREDVAALLREVRRLGRMLEDVLDWVRSGDGARETLDAHQLLRSALGVTAFEMRRHRLKLEMPEEDAAALRVDGRRGECIHALVTLLLALCACAATEARLELSADRPERIRVTGTWTTAPDASDDDGGSAWDVARRAANLAGGRLAVDPVGRVAVLEFPRAP